MKFTTNQRAYHQRVLQEIALMIEPQKSNVTNLNIPTKETHNWAAGKVKELQTVKL